MVIPSLTFLVVSYVLGSFLVLLLTYALRSAIRVGGVLDWLLLAIIAPVPVLLGTTLASLAQLDVSYSLPPVAITILIGVLLIHYILPSILPDFQVANFGASCLLAAGLGFSTLVGGAVSGDYKAFYPFHDPSHIMVDPSGKRGDTLREDERVRRILD